MGRDWVSEDTAECDLGDARLNRRLGAMLEAMGERPGKSLPTAFSGLGEHEGRLPLFRQ
jgi:hypothetical protein